MRSPSNARLPHTKPKVIFCQLTRGRTGLVSRIAMHPWIHSFIALGPFFCPSVLTLPSLSLYRCIPLFLSPSCTNTNDIFPVLVAKSFFLPVSRTISLSHKRKPPPNKSRAHTMLASKSRLLLLVSIAAWLALITLAVPALASDVHKDGYCVMRDNCGSKRTFGKQLPCPYNQEAVEVCPHDTPRHLAAGCWLPFLLYLCRCPVYSLPLPLQCRIANISSTSFLDDDISPITSCANFSSRPAVRRLNIPKHAAARTRSKI